MSRSDGVAIEAARNPVTFLVIGDVDGDISYFVMRSLKKFIQSCERDLEYVPALKVIRKPVPAIADEWRSVDILLEEAKRAPGKLVLGLTEAGLFDPGLGRYIFGYGGGGAAVMSTRRFRMVPGGAELMKERLGKEIIKVLSLAVNSGSCSRPDCILMYHCRVEELDANCDVCPDCRRRLARGLNDQMKLNYDDECP